MNLGYKWLNSQTGQTAPNVQHSHVYLLKQLDACKAQLSTLSHSNIVSYVFIIYNFSVLLLKIKQWFPPFL